MARTIAFFVWQLALALVVTAAAAALWTLAIGRKFVHTFNVTVCLVGGVLLIFGAGAMTLQSTWKRSVSKGNVQGPQTRGRAQFRMTSPSQRLSWRRDKSRERAKLSSLSRARRV